jgi:hypothetical protein
VHVSVSNVHTFCFQRPQIIATYQPLLHQNLEDSEYPYPTGYTRNAVNVAVVGSHYQVELLLSFRRNTRDLDDGAEELRFEQATRWRVVSDPSTSKVFSYDISFP